MIKNLYLDSDDFYLNEEPLITSICPFCKAIKNNWEYVEDVPDKNLTKETQKEYLEFNDPYTVYKCFYCKNQVEDYKFEYLSSDNFHDLIIDNFPKNINWVIISIDSSQHIEIAQEINNNFLINETNLTLLITKTGHINWELFKLTILCIDCYYNFCFEKIITIQKYNQQYGFFQNQKLIPYLPLFKNLDSATKYFDLAYNKLWKR